MAKQRDSGTLREVVREPGFTPAMRDLGGLVALLDDSDEEVGEAAERAFARAASGGGAVVPSLLERLDGLSASAQVRALRVIGGQKPTDAATARRIIGALERSDARVQRAAVHVLGRLDESDGASEIASALLASWDTIPELPLARALAEAFGKLGVVDARARLEQVLEGDPELARIARKALTMLERDATRGTESSIRGEAYGDFDVDLVLFCRQGLESFVIEEVLERCASARSVRPSAHAGQITALWRGAPADLLSVRTLLGVAFALPAERGDVVPACVRALTAPTSRRVLEAWTTGVVRYRIDWEGRGHRRGATWQLVDALRAAAPEWINDPTDSTWELSIATDGDEVRVSLVPRKLKDERFLYRVRDVPAASHPTIAAALVRASRPEPGDVVWDPFVGSATELIERAIAGPHVRLIGSDSSEEALAAARANVAAWGKTEVALELGDATVHAPSGVTTIVTNPPMGRRVARDGSLAALLDAFTDHAAQVLVPGGRLAWLSPLGARTAARAEAASLRVTRRQPVDLGGFTAELQVWEKGAR